MNKELFQFKTDDEYLKQNIGPFGTKLTKLLLSLDALGPTQVAELIKCIYVKEAAIQDMSNRLVPEALTTMIEEFKNLVEEEEELEGLIPTELLEHLLNTIPDPKELIETVSRAAVRTTKKSILKRLDDVGMKLQVVFKDAPEKSEEV
jgi:hypothetical protein